MSERQVSLLPCIISVVCILYYKFFKLTAIKVPYGTLKAANGGPLVNNFRPNQPLHSRIVTYKSFNETDMRRTCGGKRMSQVSYRIRWLCPWYADKVGIHFGCHAPGNLPGFETNLLHLKLTSLPLSPDRAETMMISKEGRNTRPGEENVVCKPTGQNEENELLAGLNVAKGSRILLKSK